MIIVGIECYRKSFSYSKLNFCRLGTVVLSFGTLLKICRLCSRCDQLLFRLYRIDNGHGRSIQKKKTISLPTCLSVVYHPFAAWQTNWFLFSRQTTEDGPFRRRLGKLQRGRVWGDGEIRSGPYTRAFRSDAYALSVRNYLM